MHSDFAAKGKAARDLIAVPELSMESIRRRSRAAAARGRMRAFALCGAVCLIVLGTSVGFGAKIYDGVRVWLSGDQAAMVVRSFVMVREPTSRDVHNAMARATFPILFPVGLPEGTQMSMLMYSPAERPNFIEVVFRNKRTRFNVGFSLFDSSLANTDSGLLPTGSNRPPFTEAYQWQVGHETVLVRKLDISPVDASRIKAAMTQASPPASLAAIEATLRKITVVGGAAQLADIAERYAPASGVSVFLDREQIRQVPRLVRQDKPMLDSRIVYLSNIPSAHGEPDYSKATLRWPKTIVISASGVRAIRAVLLSTGVHNDCSCEILFNQPDNATFWVWKLPLSAPASARKYTVDAKTFAVSQAI